MKILSAIKLILTLKCEQSTHLVSDSLDRDLSFSERWAVRLHYVACWSCRRFGKQIRQLRDVIEKQTKPTEEPKLSPEAIERIRKSLEAES